MAASRPHRREGALPGGERRAHRQGHRRPAHPCGVRPYAGRNPQRRPVLHRPHRAEGAPLPHAQQRTAGDGQADAHVRPRLQGNEQLTDGQGRIAGHERRH